jgi:GT2 family glycosyltransferase
MQQDYPHYSVVLVDNGSTDGTVQFVREHFPAVQIIENHTNLGFAAGNNAALQQVSSPFVVLLNPDVELGTDWLSNLIESMMAEPDIGVAGCKIYQPGNNVLQHAGGYITFPQALPGHYGLAEIDRGQHDAIRDVDYVMGAAFAIRWEVIEAIGLLDEGFFLYYEDVDYCQRARNAGYRVVYLPKAQLVHMESSSTKKGSAFYYGQMHASRWRYMLKYYAAEDLLEATIPAETAWLVERGHEERLGLQYAYMNAQRQLPFLWQQRFGHSSDRHQELFDQTSTEISVLRRNLWVHPMTQNKESRQ